MCSPVSVFVVYNACSLAVREIEIQCTIVEPPTIASLYLPTSSSVPSDSSQSEFDQQETDHDTSAYTLDDSFSQVY